MRVHHLSFGSVCPVGAEMMLGKAGTLVCHCLLVESVDGLVLVDAGFSAADLTEPAKRLGWDFAAFVRPTKDLGGTAASQVKALGFSIEDVRHILITHLDRDHAGGLVDFPRAKVHVHAREHAAAMERATFMERVRYRPVQFEHGPDWALYEATSGETWKGFDSVRAIDKLGDEILMIPLHGHSRGHSAIAVHSDKGWLLHAGDAYFHHGQMDVDNPGCPQVLQSFQEIVAFDRVQWETNRERLLELKRADSDVQIFSAHDGVELERMRQKIP